MRARRELLGDPYDDALEAAYRTDADAILLAGLAADVRARHSG